MRIFAVVIARGVGGEGTAPIAFQRSLRDGLDLLVYRLFRLDSLQVVLSFHFLFDVLVLLLQVGEIDVSLGY